ncbi:MULTISPECIES: NAD(P)/FAD-dependent oxidoreductase [unclassified Thioalkalivibrio]|uniref:NAD(P)/FAD-dependent oxidoreductase n=1 Tax=unclassified Thioalkalivibrio TaxID=2621013 RepID=UPI0003735A9A|nr:MULTISPECIES: FAD/NAD(P)-binding oxidoreductase [unclassified Thioalkalivibrio]
MHHPEDPKHPEIEKALARQAQETLRGISRRDFLKIAGAAGLVSATGVQAAPARAAVSSQARIVVLGGGAAGMTMAARLRDLLDGARITIVEPSEIHHYQPGWTLVAAGVYSVGEVQRRNERYIPRGVEWVRSAVAAIDPESQRVETTDGDRLDYDFLVVATGLHLDYEAIEGLRREDIGRPGLTSLYASAEAARDAYEQIHAFGENGGVARFTIPNTPIKCAGAPIKATFIADDLLRSAGQRNGADFHYHTGSDTLFSVQRFDHLVRDLYAERGVSVNDGGALVAVDVAARQAQFETRDGGRETVDYDYLHVTPPMRAHDFVRDAGLAVDDGPLAAGGWLAVDDRTLQHTDYPNIFGAGDVVATAIGKTASTVRSHGAVMPDNLVDVIQDREPSRQFDGYTSCPLITEVGKAALVEFDYSLQEVPTFSFLDQGEPSWMWWRLKVHMIKPLYFNMLRGRYLR